MHKQAYKQIVGWDVGGAHLKAALLRDGKLQQVIQVPCALWRGLNELESAIDEVINAFDIVKDEALHAITMTGELVDLFNNRQQGVAAISHVMNTQLSGEKNFLAGHGSGFKFVSIDEVSNNWQSIASANWLASSSYIACELKKLNSSANALLIDIGSTTTDFIAIKNGKPQCLGFTDASRLQTEELVYTGVVRTPLMALTQKISFDGHMTSVAAEYFATMADVYRITGDLKEADDMADTADGKEKTLEASTRRLARMIGHDADDKGLTAWIALADAFKRVQLERLTEVAQKHLARIGSVENNMIIGAGAGKFLVEEIAKRLGLTYRDCTSLFENQLNNNPQQIEYKANVCLPAYAVAYLALKSVEKY